MKATVQHFHVADDPEAGSAFALLLTAAGYEVETDFIDGSTFISADGLELELCVLDELTPQVLARNLREKLDAPVDEVELAELSSEFHKVA